jgi:hypothetical protein
MNETFFFSVAYLMHKASKANRGQNRHWNNCKAEMRLKRMEKQSKQGGDEGIR